MNHHAQQTVNSNEISVAGIKVTGNSWSVVAIKLQRLALRVHGLWVVLTDFMILLCNIWCDDCMVVLNK